MFKFCLYKQSMLLGCTLMGKGNRNLSSFSTPIPLASPHEHKNVLTWLILWDQMRFTRLISCTDMGRDKKAAVVSLFSSI